MTVVQSDPKAPLAIATTPRSRGGRDPFPGLLHFTLDAYLIMLSVKQGGIKHQYFSLWYDLARDWTPVSRTIGEHSNHYANGPVIPKTKKCYLMPPCFTLSIMKYGSRVKWGNPGNGVAPSPTPRCRAIEKWTFWSPSAFYWCFWSDKTICSRNTSLYKQKIPLVT